MSAGKTFELLKENSHINELLGKSATKEEIVTALFNDQDGIPEHIQDTLIKFCSDSIDDEEWKKIENEAFIYPLLEEKTDLNELDIMNLVNGGLLDDAQTNLLKQTLQARPDRIKILTSLDYALRSGLSNVIDLSDASKAMTEYERLQEPLMGKEERSLQRLLQILDKEGKGDLVRFRLHISSDNQPFTPGLVKRFLQMDKAGQASQILKWEESRVKPVVDGRNKERGEKVLNDKTKLESISKKVDRIASGAKKAIEGGVRFITNPEDILKGIDDKEDQDLILQGAVIALTHSIIDSLDLTDGTPKVPEDTKEQDELGEKIAILNSVRVTFNDLDVGKILNATNLDSKFKDTEVVKTTLQLLGVEVNIFNIPLIDEIKKKSGEFISEHFEKSFQQAVVIGNNWEITSISSLEERTKKIAQLLQRVILINSVLDAHNYNITDPSVLLSHKRFLLERLLKDSRTTSDPMTLFSEGKRTEASLAVALGIIANVENIQRLDEINIQGVVRNSLQRFTEEQRVLAKEMVEMYFQFKSDQSGTDDDKLVYSAICRQFNKREYFKGADVRRESVFDERRKAELQNIQNALLKFHESVTQSDVVPESVPDKTLENKTITPSLIRQFEVGIEIIKNMEIKGLLEVVHKLKIVEKEGPLGLGPKTFPKLNALKTIASKIGIQEVIIGTRLNLSEVSNGQEEQLQLSIVEKVLPNPDGVDIENLGPESLAELDNYISQYEENSERTLPSGDKIEIEILTGRLSMYRERINNQKTKLGIQKLQASASDQQDAILKEEIVAGAYAQFLGVVGVDIR